jgi:hypothetical protein
MDWSRHNELKVLQRLTFGGLVKVILALWQIECPHQEYRHLGTRD